MAESVLTVVGKAKYVCFQIGAGHFNELEERGRTRYLIAGRAHFLQAVAATMPDWHRVIFPAAFRPVYEIMRQVRFERDPDGPLANQTDIRLTDSAIIRHRRSGLAVYLPIEEFVPEAVAHLAERPYIDLGHRAPEHQEEFLRLWAETICKLENPAGWLAGV